MLKLRQGRHSQRVLYKCTPDNVHNASTAKDMYLLFFGGGHTDGFQFKNHKHKLPVLSPL